jgi:hypothetical protein
MHGRENSRVTWEPRQGVETSVCFGVCVPETPCDRRNQTGKRGKQPPAAHKVGRTACKRCKISPCVQGVWFGHTLLPLEAGPCTLFPAFLCVPGWRKSGRGGGVCSWIIWILWRDGYARFARMRSGVFILESCPEIPLPQRVPVKSHFALEWNALSGRENSLHFRLERQRDDLFNTMECNRRDARRTALVIQQPIHLRP